MGAVAVVAFALVVVALLATQWRPPGLELARELGAPWWRLALSLALLAVTTAAAFALASNVPPNSDADLWIRAGILVFFVVSGLLLGRSARRKGIKPPPPMLEHGPPGREWDPDGATWRPPK